MITIDLSGLPFAPRLTEGDDEIIHAHSYYECFYVIEGSIYHEIGGEQTLLNIGDAVIVAPEQSHNFHRTATHNGTHRDNGISKELFASCCNFLDKEIYERLQRDKYIQFSLSYDDVELCEKNIFKYISAENIEQRAKFEKFLVTSLISYILLSDRNPDLLHNDFQKRCISIIGELFTARDSIKQIYAKLQFNESYLSKKFKQTFGTTLTDYVNNLKIKHAAYLLSMTEMTIPAVCDMVGIESIPYFYKLFKKHYGSTPRKIYNK